MKGIAVENPDVAAASLLLFFGLCVLLRTVFKKKQPKIRLKCCSRFEFGPPDERIEMSLYHVVKDSPADRVDQKTVQRLLDSFGQALPSERDLHQIAFPVKPRTDRSPAEYATEAPLPSDSAIQFIFDHRIDVVEVHKPIFGKPRLKAVTIRSADELVCGRYDFIASIEKGYIEPDKTVSRPRRQFAHA